MTQCKLNKTAYQYQPIVLDLFCGAGGLSVGFEAAGYRVVGGIDNNEVAIQTFTTNIPESKSMIRDLRKSDISDIADFVVSLGSGIDVVIGGPACQGFSTSGGLSRNSGRDEKDPRNRLFINYLEIVNLLQPYWVLFENVPGLLLYDNGRIALEMVRAFREIGYALIPIILLAADYGVPQLRRRLIFIGNRTGSDIAFPAATHGNSEIWKNYALPFAHLSRIGHADNAGALAHVTFDEACSDLPPVVEGETLDGVPYGTEPLSAYQRAIRIKSQLVRQHTADVLAALDRLAAQTLKPGENWRDMPEGALPERFKRIRRYDATTLLRRLRGDQPTYTITTKFNEATTGAFIHPYQTRTLTLREAARIQSFPDSFVFEGTASQVRQQIGNAVPPLLAQCLGEAILPLVVRDVAGIAIPNVRDVVFVSNTVKETDILQLKAQRRQNLANTITAM